MNNKTVLNRNINIIKTDLNAQQQLINILNINSITADILSKIYNINISNAGDFINPKLKNLLPNPEILKGMTLGVKHICDAILNSKKIGILGDYDVDGVTSSAMLKLFLNWCGVEPEIIIPDRFKDGYGPSISLFTKMHAMGIDTIITLDCGTVAFDPIEYAVNLGMHVVVVDHHISQEKTPDAIAIINPNQISDESDMNYLCAAGVTFLLCVCINSYLKNIEYFNGKSIPNILNLTHFAMLGSVCDMMKMVGLNRAFYRTGIEVLRKNLKNIDTLDLQTKSAFIGISALMKSGGIDEISSTYDVGFVIGPMINAGGRIDSAMIGVNLLTNSNLDEAIILANKLKHLNQDRKGIQDEILQDAKQKADLMLASGKNIIFIISKDWHEGVIGIVASKIKDLYQKPVIIGSISNNSGVEIIKASCRSIDGIDIGACVIAAFEEKIILKGGGHKAAAGFSMKYQNYNKLYDFFEKQLHENITHLANGVKIDIHCEVSIEQLNDSLKEIEKLEPFGVGNPRPVFLIKDAILGDYKILKDIHYRLNIRSKHKILDKYIWKNAILFNANERPLGDFVKKHIGKDIKIICNIDFTEYGLSINVLDFVNN